jgi:hypothetical protein
MLGRDGIHMGRETDGRQMEEHKNSDTEEQENRKTEKKETIR